MAVTIIASFSSFFLSLILSTAATTAKTSGFSVELIHRDSPKSPFYNPLESPSQRVANALRHSISRTHHFLSSGKNDAPRSNIISNAGQYLMNISLGTPPFPILAIADTGSDLVWTQCEPCQCYKQDAPFYNPNSSSTYKTIPCSATQCKKLQGTSCSDEFDPESTCIYSVTYGDQSFTNGDLALDTITLSSTSGQPVALPNITVGCGNNNDGTFNERGSGIIGLGAGDLSLISQMGKSIGGKFSYCLVPLTATIGSSSKINFGSNGIVSGPEAVSTPLVRKTSDSFYYLTLEGISVDGERINVSGSFALSKGNIVIDSGTPLTVLPTNFFALLKDAVSSKINATQSESTVQGLQLCYDNSERDIKVPDITVHFTSADVKLKPLNTFVQVNKKLICFSFIGRDGGAPPIYGNLVQMNFLVGYDTQEQTVSFKPTDCTKA
ncbi:hypothetical protein SLEP1_g17346 [Rubroshorea leprosula]|uniref:Peptidase A1 domain-containing protein n=1 Tax=Rubroshorea leprosula TaxID=152421 RepID=A0AAV5J5N8_9ROSI|nr:hypothetical protein SLEP1_g17346 [Rubroshorea leprosula]